MASPDHEALRGLAGQHLGPAQAAAWLELLRPTVQLARAEPGQTPVAQFGGTTRLPEDMTWPVWTGVGPLSLLLEVDLDALHAHGLDTENVLPTHGRLLAFGHAGPIGVPFEPTISSTT